MSSADGGVLCFKGQTCPGDIGGINMKEFLREKLRELVNGKKEENTLEIVFSLFDLNAFLTFELESFLLCGRNPLKLFFFSGYTIYSHSCFINKSDKYQL